MSECHGDDCSPVSSASCNGPFCPLCDQARSMPQPTDTAAISHSFSDRGTINFPNPQRSSSSRRHGGGTNTPAVTGGWRKPTYSTYSVPEFIDSPCSRLTHLGTRQVGPMVRKKVGYRDVTDGTGTERVRYFPQVRRGITNLLR